VNFPPKTVPISIAGHDYNVVIDYGVLSCAGEHLRQLTPATKVAVVTDDHVAPLYLGTLCNSLEAAGFDVIRAIVPAGETNKHLRTLEPIYNTLLSSGIERNTPVIALGGGVVGDMTGFVAATLLRGVPFVQIPTTLLAMVDASVGGKTGVNAGAGKNLIGAFHQPILVLADTNTLNTLPDVEFVSGLAECIKHEVIRDAEGFAWLEEHLDDVLAKKPEVINQFIAHNVQIKANVVMADPLERGERAHLNFGHTFGHAIEKITNYTLPHGYAVGLGMVAATRVALRLNKLDPTSADRIIKLIGRAGLPLTHPSIDVDRAVRYMAFDKKVVDGKVRLILPDKIGHVGIFDDVSRDVITAAMETLRG